MKNLILVCIIFVFSTLLAFAQISGLKNLQEDLDFKPDALTQTLSGSSQQLQRMPVASVIDADKYYLGPDDILSILALPMNVLPLATKVSSECEITIPRLGSINVKNKTLKQAKEEIETLFKANNPNATVFVSLFSPRTVLIRVQGNVRNPGLYNFPANFRISDVINFTNEYDFQKTTFPTQINFQTFLEKQERNRKKEFDSRGLHSSNFYVTRNIIVYNQNYGIKRVDLEKRISEPNSNYDPYIREGDEIFVPFEPQIFDFVTLAGAVTRPGRYAFVSGDKASDLLKFGISLKNNADLNNVILINEGNVIKLEIDSNLNVLGINPELKPFAKIIVNEKSPSELSKEGLVKIDGAVRKPGFYQINNGKTKVLEIIEQAGGVTAEANLSQAYILRNLPVREQIEDPEEDYSLYLKHSNMTMEDSTRLKIDVRYKQNYVSCDFFELVKNGASKHNIALEDGDLIYIPPAKNRVFVWGQVKNPGYIDFVPGKDYNYYIERAGGLLPTAKSNRIRVIRGIQKIWLEPKGTQILDGDEIYVPRSPDIPPGVEFQYYSLIATGVATFISLVYLILNLTRRN